MKTLVLSHVSTCKLDMAACLSTLEMKSEESSGFHSWPVYQNQWAPGSSEKACLRGESGEQWRKHHHRFLVSWRELLGAVCLELPAQCADSSTRESIYPDNCLQLMQHWKGPCNFHEFFFFSNEIPGPFSSFRNPSPTRKFQFRAESFSTDSLVL